MCVRSNTLTNVRGLLAKRTKSTIVAIALDATHETCLRTDVSLSAARNVPRLSTSLFHASPALLRNAAELLGNVGTWKKKNVDDEKKCGRRRER